MGKNPTSKTITKNKEEESQREYDEMVARVAPTARNIIKMVAENVDDLPLGTGGALDDAWIDLAKKSLQIMEDDSKETGLRYADRNFLFQLVAEPFNVVQQHGLNSINRLTTDAMTVTAGEPIEEMTIEALSKFVKKAAQIRLDTQEKKEKNLQMKE